MKFCSPKKLRTLKLKSSRSFIKEINVPLSVVMNFYSFYSGCICLFSVMVFCVFRCEVIVCQFA